MASSFCTNCGHKMTYNFAPPNFCGACGTKISASIVGGNSPAKPSKVVSKVDNEDEFIDDEDGEFSSSEEIPSIRSFAYDIENDSQNRQYQLGELFGQPKTFSRKTRSMSLDDLKERHGKNK
jgi:hypothetical protein